MSKELVNVLRESRVGLCQRLMREEDSEAARDARSNISLGGRVVVSASKTLVSESFKKTSFLFVIVFRLFCKLEILICILQNLFIKSVFYEREEDGVSSLMLKG